LESLPCGIQNPAIAWLNTLAATRGFERNGDVSPTTRNHIQHKTCGILAVHSRRLFGGAGLKLKSGRPIYVIILFVVSSIYMGLFFLPLLYSLLFPNADIEQVVAALKNGGIASMDADTVVEQAKAALGPLTKAIQVGWGYDARKQYHLAGSHEQTTITATSYTYVAWFAKLPKPVVVQITLYENDASQKAYRISRVSGILLARQLAIPLLLFVVSVFLMFRKSKASKEYQDRGLHKALSVSPTIRI
jgi:hypothetical protein